MAQGDACPLPAAAREGGREGRGELDNKDVSLTTIQTAYYCYKMKNKLFFFKLAVDLN